MKCCAAPRTLALRVGLVRAVRLGAVGVKLQRMLANREAAFRGDTDLALLDFGVIELFDASALHAHQMIVMAALIQLEHRLAGLEMVALEYSGLFELGEDAVDRGEPDVQSLVYENPIDVLGRQVAHLAVFEKLQDSQPRARGLQAAGFQVVDVGHGGSPRGRCPFPLSYSVSSPRKHPDRAANADFGVTVSHCGVRSCAEPRALPDGNPAGELHNPGNDRTAQARSDPRSGAIFSGHALGQRHLSRRTLGLRFPPPTRQQP